MSIKKKTTMGIIGNRDDNALILALASSLITGAGRRAKRTQAEKDAMDAQIQAKRDEEVRQARILKNICPNCEGKLVRGRKQKHNDYKRAWRCVDCTKVHSM